MSDKPNEPTTIEEHLAVIMKRCDAITPGEMVVYCTGGDEDELGCWYVGKNAAYGWLADANFGNDTNGCKDAKFYLASRTDVPRLLELVEYVLGEGLDDIDWCPKDSCHAGACDCVNNNRRAVRERARRILSGKEPDDG